MTRMKNKENKVLINYLDFLNYPEFDNENREWFFTYLDPESEETIRVSEKFKIKLFASYKSLKQKLLKLQKSKKVKIVTKTKIVVEKKKEAHFKNQVQTHHNKLTSKEINTKALELKIQGYERENIILELINVYQISDLTAKSAADWCYMELAKDVEEDFVRLTVLSHSLYYDDLFKKLNELAAPKLALRSLRAKEILNGIGTDIFEIQVNNIFQDTKELVNYGLSRLSTNEKNEFINILSRVNEINDAKQIKEENK